MKFNLNRRGVAAATGGAPRELPYELELPTPDGVKQNALAEFWDVGDKGFIAQQLEPDHEFTVAMGRPFGGPRILGRLLLFCCLAVSAWAAYDVFVLEQDPVEDAVATYDMAMKYWFGDDEAATTAMPQAKGKKAAAQAAPKAATGVRIKAVAGNPYWGLPNRVLGDQAAMDDVWTPDEEEAWRVGLAHRFPYQRYKTVQEMRKKRRAGSEVLFWEAISDKQFWTRMYAAIGLAEFNVEVALKPLEAAMDGERSELVANFFERFVRRPNPGQLFIMRQALRLCDERGRLVILRAIHRSKDELRDVYMTAASLDPSSKVQAWFKSVRRSRPVDSQRFAALLPMIRGEEDADDELAALIKDAGNAPKVDHAPKFLPPRVVTDEDLDSDGNLIEGPSAGAVQVFDNVLELKANRPKPAVKTKKAH